MRTPRPIAKILETPRLILREVEPEDLDVVADMLTDPEVMRFWPRPYKRKEAAEWLDRQRERYRQFGFGYWLGIERATGQAVGQFGLLPRRIEGVDGPDVGYITAKAHWRRGFAKEAATACVHFALNVLKAPRVFCLIRPENTASLAVARRIGMAVEPDRLVEIVGLRHLVLSKVRGTNTPPR